MSYMTNILTRGAVAAGLAGLIAAPAAAVNIPEGGAVSADSLFVINFQVQEGCDGSPTDALAVTIPESVQNPQPESVSGWDVTVETVPAEGDDAEGERTVVRWSGGPLPDGTYKEFGLRARFPDEPGATIAFPVVQTCGSIERAWTDDEGEMAAPTVTLNERFGPRDILELRDSMVQLRSEFDELSEQLMSAELGDVNVSNLRSRVNDTEQALQDVLDRLAGLEEGSSPSATGSFSAAEQVLLRGIPGRIADTCSPRRSSLLGGARAAVTCRPNTNVVARLDYFLLEGDSADDHFQSLMERRSVPDLGGGQSCEDGVKSQTWWVGGMGSAEGCYRWNGRAHLRFVDRATDCRRLEVGEAILAEPAIYIALRGTNRNVARLHDWATRNLDDDSGLRTSITQFIPSDLGISPACPT